jgi:cytochrome c-type biogenesis protein CcmH
MNSLYAFLIFFMLLVLAARVLVWRPYRFGRFATLRRMRPSLRIVLGLMAVIPLAAGGLYVALELGTALPAPDAVAQQPSHPTGAAGNVADAAAGVKPGASAISGTVRLAPQMMKAVAPDDAVFVFARTVGGSRMPLAVLRARAADLPLDFILDSSNALNPDRTLEKAGSVVVEARVSKRGDARAQPGDLLGQLDGVKAGTNGVAVVIDRVM